MYVTKFNGGKSLIKIQTNKYLFDPNKKVSKGQRQVQDFLLPFWKGDVILQELRIPGCLKRLDIVNLSQLIIVEYSPESHHAEYNKFFHGSRLGFLKTIKADYQKEEWAKNNGFKWVEITETDLDNLSKKFFLNKFGLEL